MEISALTRSVVKNNHAVISADGYVNSQVPGWTNCTVNVIINEQMGARFCQTMITLGPEAQLKGATKESQIFFYVVSGQCQATMGNTHKTLTAGHFVYIPVNTRYQLDHASAGTRLLGFHKKYEKLEGYDTPSVIYGDAAKAEGAAFLGDPALR
jgi:(S)-ureidoglycine aminohydrolase